LYQPSTTTWDQPKHRLPQVPEISIISFEQRFKKALRWDVSLRDIKDMGLRDIRE
jgi:hypothetical protein